MDQASGAMRGGGGQRPGGGAPAKPATPKVNNIKIQIPETTFHALIAQRQQQQGPQPGQAGAGPPGGRPPMDPRVLQALMQRAQGGQSAAPAA